jgi:hypothetical protein
VRARHHLGRLAFHVRAVRVLVDAATKQPGLFEGPQVKLLKSPPAQSVVPPPSIRHQKTRLDEIALRMVPRHDPTLLEELQTRLAFLDDRFGVEARVREEYARKTFQPRVHAELIVIEHFHHPRTSLHYLDHDPYVGTSKPACYCCALYIREHPAGFEAPSSHQKICLNWMPPTSIQAVVKDPDSELAVHEQRMLNKMVESVRRRTVEQIRTRTYRRQRQFDSITGETLSTRAVAAIDRGEPEPLGRGPVQPGQ